eukprot:scaffold305727_cov31-Tisochrysis_lutea.AAC.1
MLNSSTSISAHHVGIECDSSRNSGWYWAESKLKASITSGIYKPLQEMSILPNMTIRTREHMPALVAHNHPAAR